MKKCLVPELHGDGRIAFDELKQANGIRLRTPEILNTRVNGVYGLRYMKDYITPEEAHTFMQFIDRSDDVKAETRPIRHASAHALKKQSNHWSTELARRTQQFGYTYQYNKKNHPPTPTQPIPDVFLPLAKRLCYQGWFPQQPDQLIINEYQPGAGYCGAHRPPTLLRVDCRGSSVC